MTNPNDMLVTPLHYRDVKADDKIVSYIPGTEDHYEVIIIAKTEVIEKGEVADIVIYRYFTDNEDVERSSSPCDLGLSQSSNGTWYRRAVPFNENK